MKTFLWMIATLTLSQTASATSAKDLKHKATETVDAAADYSKEQKDAFVKDMEENIADLKTQIKTMKEKAGESKDETLKSLEIKQAQLEKDLAKMKKSGGNAWNKLKTGVSKAWSEIKTSMSEAKEELKK
jgi:myosin heavy subunit